MEEQILRDPKLSGNYLLVLTRDGHLDQLEVRCELQRSLSGRLTDAERATIAHELQHRIKTFIGVSTRVTVLDADTLPRTQTGKAKRVQDERPRAV